MNHPARPVADELRAVAGAGFDFVDLSLEPPGAWPPNVGEIGRLLGDLGLGAVGHTSPHLSIASAFAGIRREAHDVLHRCFAAFAELGVEVVNVHPDQLPGMFSREETVRRNAEAVAELAEQAVGAGVRLMVENMGRSFSRVEELHPLLDAAPSALFHLDVGHANMGRRAGEPNRTAELLAAFGDRLAHVHVHDNLGGDDLHLPLGKGTVDWPEVTRLLRGAGYDGTVTFEIFSGEHAHVATSVRLWREWWQGGSVPPSSYHALREDPARKST